MLRRTWPAVCGEWQSDFQNLARGNEPEIRPFIPQDVWDMNDLYGDYTVCPFTHERAGWMQYVCIARATHLVLAPLDRTSSQRKEPGAKP